jgi:Fur family zinc uptake transcriptional regulator
MAMSACKHHQRCVKDALAEAKTLCDARQVRFTGKRQRVLELVWASHRPAKAYDILSALQQEDSSARPPTVYRALDFLLELGLIHKLHRLNAYIGCSHLEQSGPCFFLICRECGEVTEEDDPQLEAFVAAAAQKHQFMPGQTTLEMEGICRRCAG